jgi:hypothetical protein
MTNYATLTNEELDLAIDDAYGAMLDAWQAQCQTTVEEGFTLEQAEAATQIALSAEAHYRCLCGMREARETLRRELGKLITQTNAVPVAWSESGPWMFAFYGAMRFTRAIRLVEFCRARAMPFRVTVLQSGIAVKFNRPFAHISSLGRSDGDVEITPQSPRIHPSSITALGGTHAEDVHAPALALSR